MFPLIWLNAVPKDITEHVQKRPSKTINSARKPQRQAVHHTPRATTNSLSICTVRPLFAACTSFYPGAISKNFQIYPCFVFTSNRLTHHPDAPLTWDQFPFKAETCQPWKSAPCPTPCQSQQSLSEHNEHTKIVNSRQSHKNNKMNRLVYRQKPYWSHTCFLKTRHDHFLQKQRSSQKSIV